jgi:hypothetical protein
VTAAEIIAKARAEGHLLQIEDGGLRVVPKPDAELRVLLIAHKAEITALLETKQPEQHVDRKCPDNPACPRQHHRWRDGGLHHVAETVVSCAACGEHLARCQCPDEEISEDELREAAAQPDLPYSSGWTLPDGMLARCVVNPETRQASTQYLWADGEWRVWPEPGIRGET